MFEKLKKIKKKWFFILIPIVLFGGYFLLSSGKSKVEYTTAKVALGTIKQTVSETGMVEAPEDLNLSFLTAGRVAKIYVKEGEEVLRGQILMELDYGALLIKEREAEANLDKLLYGATGSEIKVARANVNQAQATYDAAVKDLDKTRKTAAENNKQAEKKLSDLTNDTAADLTTYEQAVKQAKTSLENTKKTYQTALSSARTDALATAEDAILKGQTALDKVKVITDDDAAEKQFSIMDRTYVDRTDTSYLLSTTKKTAALAALNTAKSSLTDADINNALAKSTDFSNQVLDTLDNCFKGLEKSLGYTTSVLDTYKTTIAAQITLITTSIASLNTDDQALEAAILNYNTKVSDAEESLAQDQAALDNAKLTAENNLDSTKLTGEAQLTAAESKVDTSKKSLAAAQASLDKVLAGSNNYDVIAAQASLDSVKRQIEDSRLTAPVSGQVTKISYEVGETASLTSPAVSMIGNNDFNIKVDVSEIDVAKISLGNECDITFDAFGAEKKFEGKVYFIDTAPTIIQDVVYYKVKVKLEGTTMADELNASSTVSGLGLSATSTVSGREKADKATDNKTTNETEIAGETENANLDYSQIKPGMTANVDIFAAKKDNVLIMPLRAVVDKNGSGKFVRVMDGKTPKEVPVEIGLKGDEGMVEVISGVKEGDEVVTFVKDPAKP